MLETLKKIVQDINSVQNFPEALRIFVSRVRQAIDASVCLIYLTDLAAQQYVLVAADGLKTPLLEPICIPVQDGLIGLIGQRKEPLHFEDARMHPAYKEHLNDHAFLSAFLGVPIIYHRKLLGVAVVQRKESRRFDESEEAFLITITAQMAGIIAHADYTGALQKTLNTKDHEKADHTVIYGLPTVLGVAIGKTLVLYKNTDLDSVPDRVPQNISDEILNFQWAISATIEEYQLLSQKLSEVLPRSELALFDVYLRILDDNTLLQEVIREIESGNWAPGALRKILLGHIACFENMEDIYLKERGDDLRDLGNRILVHLQKHRRQQTEYPIQTILVGENITASDLADVPSGCLVGMISCKGSSNSHVAIFARALGIPTVTGVAGFELKHFEGKEIIVDGYYGHIYLSPSEELRAKFKALADEEIELNSNLQKLREKPAETPDGHHISLCVNTGLETNASLSLSVGAEGVGLFRTEVHFIRRESFPTEEEQRILYHQLLKAFSPRPVIMRTLDVGGDKPLPYFPVKEENPYLGWRGIRITLDHPEMFLVQVRAMLKASSGLNNLRILLPMISQVNEVDESLRLIQKAYQEVKEEGFSIQKPLIGVMVEVPSAVYQVAAIARRIDFLSIGSNDLVQYLLAVDRNNPRVAGLYDDLHPAVLMALQHVVEIAHDLGKKVSICGEMASDPVAVILLMGLNFDALSMNSTALLRVKYVIRNFPKERAQGLLTEVMRMDNPQSIRRHIEQALMQAGLGGLIRAGKQ